LVKQTNSGEIMKTLVLLLSTIILTNQSMAQIQTPTCTYDDLGVLVACLEDVLDVTTQEALDRLAAALPGQVLAGS
jgi:hypothetical protein